MSVFSALIDSMNFVDKPIDEALRYLQEVFQITVSSGTYLYACLLYGILAMNGDEQLFDLTGRSTID